MIDDINQLMLLKGKKVEHVQKASIQSTFSCQISMALLTNTTLPCRNLDAQI